ncbi:MAG TPA: hypothetical protein VJ825_10505 [Gemmatimonadaceae bacterium]|nr:hypothetical protein [Gemmatimonadaceae bacterium]
MRPPPDDLRLDFRPPDDFEVLFFRPPPDELRLVEPDLAFAPPPLVRPAPLDDPPPVLELVERVPPEVDVDPVPKPPVRAAPVAAGVLLPP